MASRPRRALATDAFHEEMQRPTTTSKDHKTKLKKLQDTATNICTRMTKHREIFPGYRSCYRCFAVRVVVCLRVLLLRRTKCHVQCTVHIRPECESIYCAGTAPTGATSQEEQETSDNMHRALIKTWDARMTTLEGEFVTNSKFIDWLIRLMMSSSPDTDTDEVIRAAVLKALSDAMLEDSVCPGQPVSSTKTHTLVA